MFLRYLQVPYRWGALDITMSYIGSFQKKWESTTASTVRASNHMFGFLFSISTIVSPAESTVLLATRLSFSL